MQVRIEVEPTDDEDNTGEDPDGGPSSFRVTPMVIQVGGVPGGRRNAQAMVHYRGPGPLRFQCEVLPFDGPWNDEIEDELSVHEWVEVQPVEFTMSSGENRRLKLLFKFPPQNKPHYFGLLRVTATTLEGKPAGENLRPIVARNTRATHAPIRGLGLRLMWRGTQQCLRGTYFIPANRYPRAICRAELLRDGRRRVGPIKLGPVPRVDAELCDYEGELALERLEPGPYLLRVALEQDGRALHELTRPVIIRLGQGNGIVEFDDAPDDTAQDPRPGKGMGRR